MERIPATEECSVCRKPFVQWNSLKSAVCSVKCARQVPVIERKKERANDRQRREAVKTRSDWQKEAQVAFNAYIRQRDIGLPCICCGSFGSELGSRGGDWDAGHYRSVGSAPHLRFDETNCHRQLKRCNRYGAGRAVDYRIGLIKRLGPAKVERLEADQTLSKYTAGDLRVIRDEYRRRLREMKTA